MFDILEVLIFSIFIVVLRRLILSITAKMKSRPLREGFKADCILLWSSIFIPYFLTHNINVSLVAFLFTLIGRFFYTRMFFMLPNTHTINDFALFIWSFIILYLIKKENNLSLQVKLFNY
jgi:hypothetical protein